MVLKIKIVVVVVVVVVVVGFRCAGTLGRLDQNPLRTTLLHDEHVQVVLIFLLKEKTADILRLTFFEFIVNKNRIN